MRALWFIIGVILGVFLADNGFPEWFTILVCAIPLSISWFMADKKYNEEQEEYLRKHSWWN